MILRCRTCEKGMLVLTPCPLGGCTIYFHPLDAALQAPAHGEVAPVFGSALSLLGVEVTYGTGSRLLESLANRKLDKSTIDRQVQRDGKCLQQLERDEADALWPYDEKGYARTTSLEVLKTKGPVLSLPPRAGRVLIMQGDGAMGNLAQEPDVKAEKLREQRKADRKAREAKKAGIPQKEDDSDSVPSSFRESMQLVIYRLDDVVRKPVPVPKGRKRGRLKFRKVESPPGIRRRTRASNELPGVHKARIPNRLRCHRGRQQPRLRRSVSPLRPTVAPRQSAGRSVPAMRFPRRPLGARHASRASKTGLPGSSPHGISPNRSRPSGEGGGCGSAASTTTARQPSRTIDSLPQAAANPQVQWRAITSRARLWWRDRRFPMIRRRSLHRGSVPRSWEAASL